MRTAVILATSALAVAATSGPIPDPAGLMRRVVENASAPEERVEIRMVLEEKGGKARERSATLWSRRVRPEAPGQRKLIRFSFPPELARSAVLTVEGPEEDEQWVYIPAVYTTRRIASGNRADRYMGTDFSYEDILAVRMEENSFVDRGTEPLGDRLLRKVEQVPTGKASAASGYSKVLHWVDPEAEVIWRSDYYDREGRLVKRLTSEGLRKHGRFHRFDKVRMETLGTGRSTTVEYRSRELGQPVPEALFTLRNLERG